MLSRSGKAYLKDLLEREQRSSQLTSGRIVELFCRRKQGKEI